MYACVCVFSHVRIRSCLILFVSDAEDVAVSRVNSSRILRTNEIRSKRTHTSLKIITREVEKWEEKIGRKRVDRTNQGSVDGSTNYQSTGLSNFSHSPALAFLENSSHAVFRQTSRDDQPLPPLRR